jgi:anhydro-N-acetylmuramic acid kinase
MNKANCYVGLMSGTSLDGVDAICVTDTLQQIATHHEPYPIQLKQALHQLIVKQETSLLNLGTLDHQLGQCYAQSVLSLLKKINLTKNQIAAIGCHGQTVFHQPNSPHPFTMQLGDPTILAAKTGIAVVHDFRRMDMALGGQGAPLAPLFHQAVFGKAGVNRAIVNIGGMANVSLLDGKQLISGFDTGPGNALLDAWIFECKQLAYDKNGAWGRSGRVNETLLKKLLADNYFQQSPPKSTGKEKFHLNWLKKYLIDIPAQDVQATLVEFTAITICQSFALANLQPQEIYICGGGAYNLYLMERIQQISQLPTKTTADLGIDPEWVEAGLIAWLTAQNIKNHRINFSAATGSKTPLTPGCLTKP